MLDRTKGKSLPGEAFISPAAPAYAQALTAWFDQSFRAAQKRAGYGPVNRLALPMLAYGDYVERFLDLTLPSLLAPGNLDELYRPVILAHTDERGARLLTKAGAIIGERAEVEVHVVPTDLIEQVNDEESNKYWLLGCAQQLQMQIAKCLGLDYHMLYPDMIYAREFFSNLMKLVHTGHTAIVHGTMSGVLQDVAPRFRAGKCNFSPADLTALVLDHLHRLTRENVVNARSGYPAAPLFLYVGEGRLHYVCPHMNLIYLAHEHLFKVPLVGFNTVDAALAQVIPPEVEVYAPVAADGIAWAELSSIKRFVTPSHHCELGELALRFWVLTWCEEKFIRYINLDIEMPLPQGYRPPWAPMTEAEIADHKAAVRKAIADSRGVAKLIFRMVADAYQRGLKNTGKRRADAVA